MKAIGAVLLTGLLVLTACAEPDPDEGKTPPPVAAPEIAQRLDEYLTSMADQTLEAGAQASPITRSQAPCAEKEVSWGVVPRAERTVEAGARVRKYFEDLTSWLAGADLSEYEDRGREAGGQAVSGVSNEGARLEVHWDWESPRLTLRATGPCSWPADRPGGPVTGQLPPPSTPRWPRKAVGTEDAAVCTSPKRVVFNPDAPPFAGPGPHLVAVIAHAESRDFRYDDVVLDEDWSPHEIHDESTPEHANTQLVACVRVEPTTDTGRDLTCHYSASLASPTSSPMDFDLFEANYHVTVRQARDGSVVEEFTLPGTVGDDRNCLSQLDDYHRTLTLGLDHRAFGDRLRPLAEPAR
ncbi:hypothetical protein [Amycolatopsis albispora]|uniref:hypothetical protein n=1 Tax=Amycolatopsis albispora TaxID=1804986 RepID=UPI0013B4291E|nr:hypothetical protein [Amycolatopsis albispora]